MGYLDDLVMTCTSDLVVFLGQTFFFWRKNVKTNIVATWQQPWQDFGQRNDAFVKGIVTVESVGRKPFHGKLTTEAWRVKFFFFFYFYFLKIIFFSVCVAQDRLIIHYCYYLQFL